jgi:hypothetical protein
LRAENDALYRTESGRKMDAVEVADRYIAKHDATLICRLNTDEKKITPLWSKVSSTPFDAPANMKQGYGRAIKSSFISVDAPRDSFLDPEVVKQPANRLDDRTACVTRVPLHQDPLLPSQVLPMGASLHLTKSTMRLEHTRFRSFAHDKRTLMEPLITERREEPIEWGPVRTSNIKPDTHECVRPEKL